ncbi:hypothetical protein A3Q56_00376 [Intoshia linei]|uniref:glutaminyl-peptide cyclotransferase n=1 Tax=Intoshia linei TaxID=1819745 RepID=A0A177BDR4_9BILA|nr:hypothetical protein A3Q56_00376 [Intoshia linei]
MKKKIFYSKTRKNKTCNRQYKKTFLWMSIFVMSFIGIVLFGYMKKTTVMNSQSLFHMDRFKLFLKPLLIERRVGTDGHGDAKKHIIDTMKSIGYTIIEHSFISKTPHGSKTFTNVIAQPKFIKSEIISFACHYDSKIYPFHFVGATDSAVPCAMLIEFAHNIFNILEQSRYTYEFIFFDGEEAFENWDDNDSLYGARQLVKDISKNQGLFKDRQHKNMKLLILLDLIGNKYPIFNPFINSKIFPILQNIEKALFPSHGIRYFKGSYKWIQIEDDHVPFQKIGVNVLHLIPYPFPQTWHTEDDNQWNIDYESIQDIGMILLHYVFYIEKHEN